MQPSTPKRDFWRGMRDGAPFILVIIPFGGLFGVVATEAGLNVFEALTFSIVVIAGAAQFTALQLMVEDVPLLIVLISALAVNLRMAMYSAALTPHLGAAPVWQRALCAYFTIDQSFATSQLTFEREPDLPVANKVAYFLGTALAVSPLWWVATVVGALLGKSVPEWMALDFAIPITFLALLTPMLRTLPHVIAALVSIVVALVFAFLPYNLGLLVAGVAAMMAGAEAERRLTRRAAA
ncbi:MAG: AzlC family ABC transporter permease [Marinovum algicola]|jgi:predicted branched-subunit amino acid permease|uniref:Predicted branched-chain amino acid permease (Azaleucine resistance) n=1 Tax=Marinovum algicola TaxID=42444 RepID=A0A975W9I8_9RHOB|nr:MULTISPECIES: AzlC family ABC transporter permease [Marinovum]AKO97966.1 putative branched-chain amino acid permease (azaleucine resistance) [Marinovum algicola DG 898]MDD9741881.1 AzlC family ABC transporter permease [Marinovum sp. SP66]SEJ37294.1 Predicted branched-chain amino acid permease (azaleucine resistance) [Marinovum algicola]SLN39478.1 Inner membrane protein YgaZ [Marinovum algicola]